LYGAVCVGCVWRARTGGRTSDAPSASVVCAQAREWNPAMLVGLLRDLTNNIAPLLGLVVVHSVLLPRLQRGESLARGGLGVLFGAAAVLGMAFPFELQSGTIFDGRTVVLSLAGFFGGPVVVGVAAVIAAGFRLWLGGAGQWMGLGTIATAAIVGLVAGRLSAASGQPPRSAHFLTLGFTVHVAALLWMIALPSALRSQLFGELAGLYLVVLTLSTWVFGHAFQISVSHHDALRQAGEAEGRFRNLVEGSPVGVYLIQNARIAYANRALEQIFGAPEQGLVGQPVDALIAADTQVYLPRLVRHKLETGGRVEGLLVTARRVDGQSFQAEMFGSLTRHEGRSAMVGTLVDVTERERAAQRLMRSERLLRQAQQAGRIGSYILDVTRGRWTMSEVLVDLLGLTPETPDSIEQWFALIVPEQRERMRAEAARILKEGTQFTHEYQITRYKDGQRRWVQASGEVERGDDGRAVRIVGVMKDIHDRKLSEQALAYSEAMHRQAQRVARLGHWEMDHGNGALTLSEQTYVVWERDPQSWTANYASFLESLHPEDRDRVDKAFSASLEQQKTFDDEYRLLLPDGRIKYIEAHGETRFTGDGRALRTIGTVQDVTERCLAQQGLARELDSTRMMLTTMTDGYIRADLNGRILDTNPAYCRMLGRTREEIVGSNIADFKAQVSDGEISQRIDRTLAAGQLRFATRHRHKDGSSVHIEASTVSLPHAQPPQICAFFRDVTQERRAESHYEDLVTQLPAGVFRYRHTGGGGHFEYLSPRLCELLMLEADAVRDNPARVFERLHSADTAEFATRREQSRISGEPFLWEGRLRDVEPPRWVRVEAGASHEDNGDVVWHGIVTDVTVRQRLLERLRLDSAVITSTFEAIMVTELDGTIISVNPAFCEITGYQPDEVIGRKPSLLKSGRQDESFYQGMYRALSEVGHWQGQLWNRRKSGEIYPELLNISVVRDPDGKPTHYVGVATDISQIKRSEEQLVHLAHHDALTGLPNRLLLGLRIEHALEQARRARCQMAVLFLDLDRFKNVNDSLGHEIGDQLLLAVARRLRGVLREQDTLGRLGGDEFLVLLEQVENSMAAAKVAEHLLGALAQPFRLPSGHELYVQSSIGICMYPADGESVDLLIRNADTAMFRAKESGRNNYQFYTEALTLAASSRLDLETRIRQAIRDDAFEVWYQPIYRFSDRRLIGAEALLRWPKQEGGFTPPDVFIPVAEDSGLIVEIGHHVLQTACRDLRGWLDQKLAIELLALNLSVQQFRDAHFEQLVSREIATAGVPAGLLELEITERGLMDLGGETLRKLDSLKALGVRLAIDDFGTGYSSLTYLKRMPVDKLKIDRGFVRDLPHDSSDAGIVHTIVAIARTLGLKVLAEGVETAEQLAFLRAAGCNECQGFLFGRAVPAEQFAMQLREQKLPVDP
jgi:diguanylate cyclase (GGDEF)-like protein/PAS domain S-box-containing protein